MDMREGGDSFDWFFLAMAHWQLGHKEEAHKWYNKATAWMDKNRPKDEELGRFRAEAAKLLGIKEKPETKKPETRRKEARAQRHGEMSGHESS